MGAQDAVTKKYMRDPRRFADAFNFLVFNGERKVIPERLKELDSDIIATLPGAKGDKGEKDGKGLYSIQRRRDLLSVIYYSDGETVYCLAGIENQTEIDYSMPLRCLLYDALTLNARIVRSPDGTAKAKGGEFLSRFKKGDRLLPVVTLVVYWGTDRWDGPLTLHDMMGDMDPSLKSCVPDYRMNLICPCMMEEDDFRKFETNMGLMLKLAKSKADREDFADFCDELAHTDML